jgi:hypothetical protein
VVLGNPPRRCSQSLLLLTVKILLSQFIPILLSASQQRPSCLLAHSLSPLYFARSRRLDVQRFRVTQSSQVNLLLSFSVVCLSPCIEDLCFLKSGGLRNYEFCCMLPGWQPQAPGIFVCCCGCRTSQPQRQGLVCPHVKPQ